VIALLEQVPQLPGTPVYTARVLAAEPLHQAADGHIRYLQDQMDRI